MKKFVIYLLVSFVVSSCDPGESLEANIVNKTSLDLKVNFISIEESRLDKTLDIKSDKKILYADAKNRLGGYILTLQEYDSIYIENSSNEILKVWKPETEGKNIYNVDTYWSLRKPSKNHFEYTFEITEEDVK